MRDPVRDFTGRLTSFVDVVLNSSIGSVALTEVV